MPNYHPQAKAELRAILASPGRAVKRCVGMMLGRHLGLDSGQEPLDASEYLGAGSGSSVLYGVPYAYSLFGRIYCVYEVNGGVVTLLAVDGWQATARVGLSRSAPDARARAWGLSS